MRSTLSSGTSVELARPSNPTRGVVLLTDVMGLRPLFDAMAARLAEQHGWAIAVPEPYPGKEHSPIEERIAQMGQFDAKRHVADCRAAAEALGTDKVGILGFCLGGTGAFRAAADDRYDRVVAIYGMLRLPESWKLNGGTDPIDDLAAVPGAAKKVLTLSGTEDHFVDLRHLDEVEALGSTVVRYQGAGHGFVHIPEAPTHRPADAADAWARTAAWLNI